MINLVALYLVTYIVKPNFLFEKFYLSSDSL